MKCGFAEPVVEVPPAGCDQPTDHILLRNPVRARTGGQRVLFDPGERLPHRLVVRADHNLADLVVAQTEQQLADPLGCFEVEVQAGHGLPSTARAGTDEPLQLLVIGGSPGEILQEHFGADLEPDRSALFIAQRPSEGCLLLRDGLSYAGSHRTAVLVVPVKAAAQLGQLQRFTGARAGSDRVGDEGVRVGVEPLPEQGLHLGLGHGSLKPECSRAGSHPYAFRHTPRRLVLLKRHARLAAFVTGCDFTQVVQVAIPSRQLVDGHHEITILCDLVNARGVKRRDRRDGGQLGGRKEQMEKKADERGASDGW